jgi:hypothetical protein
MGSVSTYIHHQIAVIVTTSGDVNRHSSSFKVATILKEWTKEEVHSVIRFLWANKFPPVEIHCELVIVHGANVMTVQHVHKWCREFDSGQVNVMDEQRTGRPSTSADLVQDIDAAVQAERRMSIAQLEIRFSLSRGTIWDIVHERLGFRKVCSRWVPHQLNYKDKKTGMVSSLMLLQCYEEHGEAFLSRIVTGDETWVFQYIPESKAELMTW